MITQTLSPQSMEVLRSYLRLPFPNKNISCPYFNNRRAKVRGALRVQVGKGTPQEIAEEARMFAFKDKIDLGSLADENLRRFLVDHNLGVDCSALVYHILDAESKARGQGPLKKHLKFPNIKNPLRKLLTKLRTVENVSVEILAHKKNSREIELKNIQPGDLIIMLDNGLGADRDHVLIVHQIDGGENNAPKTIHYTHSLNWSTDGQYHHGVRQGVIEIIDIKKPLTEQRWVENGKEGAENETFVKARRAEKILLKRINLWTKI